MIQTWLRVSLIFFYAAKVFMLGIFLWCGGTFATHHLCLLEIDHCYTAVKIEFPLGGERWEKESVAQHFVYVLRTLSVYEQFILAEYFFFQIHFFSKQMKIESLYIFAMFESYSKKSHFSIHTGVFLANSNKIFWWFSNIVPTHEDNLFLEKKLALNPP